MDTIKCMAQTIGDWYAIYNGDSAEVLRAIPDNSIHFSIYSPPFQDHYTYNPSERDLSNSTPEEFWQHYDFIIRENLRVTMPGRICCVHVADIPAMLNRHGFMGIFDFPGDTIRAYIKAGWVLRGRWFISKNPQAQAVRTKSHKLLFHTLEKDSTDNAPAIADQVLIFRKPGDNLIPVKTDLTRDNWIDLAAPVQVYPEEAEAGRLLPPFMMDIRESDTLNAREGRDNDDERHVCPLQLPLISRAIRLYTNEGETVLTCFAGIGSELYEAVKLGRRGIGVELKPSYYRTAVKNLERAMAEKHKPTLFDFATLANGSKPSTNDESERVVEGLTGQGVWTRDIGKVPVNQTRSALRVIKPNPDDVQAFLQQVAILSKRYGVSIAPTGYSELEVQPYETENIEMLLRSEPADIRGWEIETKLQSA